VGEIENVLGGVVEQNEAEEHAIAKENFRFGEPSSESEVVAKVKQSVPKSSLYKYAWAIKMFEEWRSNERNMRIRNSEGYNDTVKLEVICKSL
jgi:hypothetical protein